MIIKVEKTQSRLKNKLEIRVNNELKYLAVTPGFHTKLPLSGGNARRCLITGLDESIYYSTTHSAVENIANAAIPLQWAITEKQKISLYNIVDQENNVCGKFYTLINGYLDVKDIIEYRNETFKGYCANIGAIQYISIYKDDVQIAEIVKPLYVINDLDYYYIYLLDQYSNLEVLFSFFTVLFDFREYNNTGRRRRTAATRYIGNKNNKFYDRNWIANHFNVEDVDSLNNLVDSINNSGRGEEIEQDIIKLFKIILSLIGISFAIGIIITVILLFVLL